MPRIGPIGVRDFQSAMKVDLKMRGLTNRVAISKFVDLLRKLSQEELERFLNGLAEEMRESAVSYIESQPVAWPPLSKAYLKYKEKHPLLDERMLIASGHFVDSIRTFVNRDRVSNAVSVSVGVPPLKRHETVDRDGNVVVQNIRLGDLSKIHEYGSNAAGIPARPVWGPLRSLWAQRVRKEALPRFAKQFGRKFRASTNRLIKRYGSSDYRSV